MINRTSAKAALALTGFIGLAGCSSGDHHAEARDRRVAPVQTVAAVQAPVVADTPELSPGLVRRVQTALRRDRLYTGNVDGLWGPRTQSALRGYQQAHNLADSGEIDSATLASLRIASAADPSAPAAPPPMATAPAAPVTN